MSEATDPITPEGRAELRELCGKVKPGWTAPIEASALLALLDEVERLMHRDAYYAEVVDGRNRWEDEAASLRDKLAEAERALEQISAFNDKDASFTLDMTGSYSAFDEPGSVQLAREVLARIRSGDKTEGG